MGFRGMVAALLLVFAFGGNVRAGSSTDGIYMVLSGFNCAIFVTSYSGEVAARSTYGGSANLTPTYNTLYHYVAGWLAAYNMLTPDTFNIVPNGIDGAMLWLNNYCAKNPLKTLDDGLQALVVEAYPSRQKKPPGQ